MTWVHNLAFVFHGSGEHERARRLNENIFARLCQVVGESHPYTLNSALNLANDMRALGEEERARELEEFVRTRRQG